MVNIGSWTCDCSAFFWCTWEHLVAKIGVCCQRITLKPTHYKQGIAFFGKTLTQCPLPKTLFISVPGNTIFSNFLIFSILCIFYKKILLNSGPMALFN